MICTGLKNLLKNAKSQSIGIIRKKYNLFKRKRLKNSCPTIISRNCVGGIIYHDLGLKFTSPTVNLSMDSPDFITFIENLELLTIGGGTELMKISDDNCECPVGELRNGEISVKIDFVHYKTFDEAKTKWFERVSRMNFNNLFIIWEYAKNDGSDEELWNRFKLLDIKKVLITGNGFPNKDTNVFCTDLYDQNYYYGKLLEYQNGYKLYKRYLDDFDYVNFLNSTV